MLVVVSDRTDKKHRIYHRCGCIYEKRIKSKNRMEITTEAAERKNYHACKYCAGLRGDVIVHKEVLKKWSMKKNVHFNYREETDTLYINTNVGFWKMYMNDELGKYSLYHRNSYFAGMELEEAIQGGFHRQIDVKPMESMEGIVEYILNHDQAKVTIMDDYRKLPRSTKKQKKYYKAAERREKRKETRRVELLFAKLEENDAEMRAYSFC